MTWTMDIQGPNGGANLGTAVPFRTARLSWTADGPGAIEVDLRADDIASGLWQPGTHRVVANLDATPMWAGYLLRLTQDGPPGDIQYKASGLGLAWVLDMRIVRHKFTVTDEGANIVSDLLDEAQSQDNGDMNFTMGTVTGTTVTRRRNYCFGDVIGDCIRELAAVGRGFDWEVDATGAINIWDTSRGTDSGESLADTDTQSWSVEVELSDTLTNVAAIGQRANPWGAPAHVTVRSGLADDYGRRETTVEADTDDPDEMTDAAEAELKVAGGAHLRVRTMWLDDRGPWSFGDVWLQDTVSVALPSIFGGTQDMRCIEVSVTLEPGAYGYIEHTFEALVADITYGDPDEAS